jgi:signal transduction histidine kinase
MTSSVADAGVQAIRVSHMAGCPAMWGTRFPLGRGRDGSGGCHDAQVPDRTHAGALAARVLTGAGTAALLVAATLAEADRVVPDTAQTILVPLVGAALLLAGASASTSPTGHVPRWALGIAGAAWLLPSLVPGTERWHQAALAVALGSAAAPPVVGRFVSAAAFGLLLAGVGGQALAAALFLAVALLAGYQRRLVPGLSAMAVGVVLAASWSWARADPFGWDPDRGLIAYEFSLLLVALLFGVGGRPGRGPQLENLLAGETSAGLEGLAAVLRGYLGDPGLRVEPPRPTDPSHADALPVLSGDRLLAVITGGGPALQDPGTREAVLAAVRLVALGEERRRSLDRNTAELERARGRLLAAVDAERAATAHRLREAVEAPIEHALSILAPVDATDEVRIAGDQLSQSLAHVRATALGLAPPALGKGRLVDVLRELARGTAVPCSLDLQPTPAVDEATETALFYACSEALANAVKHAGAHSIVVTLRCEGEEVELVVADDGAGGADPDGAGLRGLADRLQRAGGRLRVDSPPGAGTLVVATAPLTVSARPTRSGSTNRSSDATPRPP